MALFLQAIKQNKFNWNLQTKENSVFDKTTWSTGTIKRFHKNSVGEEDVSFA